MEILHTAECSFLKAQLAVPHVIPDCWRGALLAESISSLNIDHGLGLVRAFDCERLRPYIRARGMLLPTERLSLSTPLKSRAPSPWQFSGGVRKCYKKMLSSADVVGLVSLGITFHLGSQLKVVLT